MTATEKRNLAAQLSGSDPEQALVIARRINDPWFACQALAWVARYSPEHQIEQIIDEALRAGSKAEDPYKIVASAAWAIRALVERHHTDKLLSIIPELLNRADEIELLASRSEALFLVFQAIFPAGRNKWIDVLQALIKASVPLISWRQKRNLRDTILIVWNEDKELAKELIDGIQDGKLKRQTERRIADSKRRLPRPFFWQAAA
jgi:hypothetical protein